MNNLAKVLIGVGVVGVVAATTYVVKKKADEKKPKDIAEQAVEQDHKDDSFLDRIKLAAYKKAVRILSWVILHKDKIEALSIILALVGGIFGIINAIREFTLGSKLHAKVTDIWNHCNESEDVWNANMDVTKARHKEILEILAEIAEHMPKKKGA